MAPWADLQSSFASAMDPTPEEVGLGQDVTSGTAMHQAASILYLAAAIAAALGIAPVSHPHGPRLAGGQSTRGAWAPPDCQGCRVAEPGMGQCEWL